MGFDTGGYLRQLRKERGWTQGDLADRMSGYLPRRSAVTLKCDVASVERDPIAAIERNHGVFNAYIGALRMSDAELRGLYSHTPMMDWRTLTAAIARDSTAANRYPRASSAGTRSGP